MATCSRAKCVVSRPRAKGRLVVAALLLLTAVLTLALPNEARAFDVPPWPQPISLEIYFDFEGIDGTQEYVLDGHYTAAELRTYLNDPGIDHFGPDEFRARLDALVRDRLGEPPTLPKTITVLEPSTGPTTGGNTVNITGTNLWGTDTVTFGGFSTGFSVLSDTLITAVVPPNVRGTVDVKVSESAIPSRNTSLDNYTYVSTIIYGSIRGSHRYATAQVLSQVLFPQGLPAPEYGLVLAPGETFQEALCGAPLAAACGGPVLLTSLTGLENGTKTEMQRLKPKYVYCIGLPATVVDAVKAALPTATVTGINGADGSVYDMSYQVAKALQHKVGGYIGSATAIITRGDVFPDAIGVSPLAYHQKWPVLLTDKGDGSALNSYAAQALSELGITQALKVGTYAQLPDGVTGVANCSGADRYYTNANVARWGQANAGLYFSHTGIATGDKFPDALAVGPYLARYNGILLLSPLRGPLPAPIASLLYTNRTGVMQVSFIACVEPVIGQVKAVLP